ncbi:MAG: SIS domain-containing protein [Candidatus Omnitrophota bacterium]
MREFTESYYKRLVELLNHVVVTKKEAGKLDFYEGIEAAGNLIVTQANSGNKLMFIGNGASAAISSHMSTDFWKNGGIKAVAFNDSSLLTCVSNDYGYKHVFAKPIEMFSDKDDVILAISSSGKSENIINGVSSARSKGCHIITLSGFSQDNPLRDLGDINFYVPESSYGLVEVVHHSICHCILDCIVESKA